MIRLFVVDKGGWVRDYDPDWQPDPDHPSFDPARTGLVDITTNEAEARLFDDFAAAHAFLGQVSTKVPVRPDGNPNRPITAYSILVERAP